MSLESIAIAPPAFAEALKEFATGWIPDPNKKEQRIFLENYFSKKIKFRDKELDTLISADAQEIDNFLQGKGFTMPHTKKVRHDEVCIATTLRVTNNWLARAASISNNEWVRMAKYMSGGNNDVFDMFQIFEPFGKEDPVAEVYAKNRDLIFFKSAEQRPKDEFELLGTIEGIRTAMHGIESEYRYKFLLFPKISLDISGSASWLLGMESGSSCIIRYAFQQMKLKINHKGALTEAAVRLRPHLGTHSAVQMDPPLLVWTERDQEIIAAFWVAKEDCKDPGEIEF